MSLPPSRLAELMHHYDRLRIAIVGDFCLDRYLEIDPTRTEVSIETGRDVHNVVRVRAQPGAAGTVLNNLIALGVGHVFPIGFCGDDGEGYELRRALGRIPAVNLEHFLTDQHVRTFTYCKPLLMHAGQPPEELNRLDSKNWDPTPHSLQQRLAAALQGIEQHVDAVVVMDQVPIDETGTVTTLIQQALFDLGQRAPSLPIVADSRRGLGNWRHVICKMNAVELAALMGRTGELSLPEITHAAQELSQRNQRPVVITLAERGLMGALPTGETAHVPAFPLRGPIDVVGAGDSVTANLACAFAVKATLHEALSLAAAASSIVIHQLGTTGTANRPQISALLTP